MKRFLAIACCLALSGLAVAALAAQPLGLYLPEALVGTYYNASTGNQLVGMQLHPDGTGFQALPYSFAWESLSRVRFPAAGGQRFWIRNPYRNATGDSNDFVAVGENGAPSVFLALPFDVADGPFSASGAVWSGDGRHLAFYLERYNADGSQVTSHALYVADVVLDAGGVPQALQNFRATPVQDVVRLISWSSDDLRIFCTVGSALTLLPVDTLGNPGAPVTVAVSGLTDPVWDPRASPAAGDNQVAFTSRTARNNGVAYDLYTVVVPPTYAGQTLPAFRVTSASNEKATPNDLLGPSYDWSPNGATLAYTTTSSNYPQIHRIASNGSGSAVTLLSAAKTGYVMRKWSYVK